MARSGADPTSRIPARALDEAVAAVADELTGRLVELVRTPSVTGDEHAAQELVAAWMRELGLEVHTLVPPPDITAHPDYCDDGLPVDRPVVVGRRRGTTTGARSLILNGHVDVVPTGDEGAFPRGPWSGAVDDGRLWGRGSCDMKGGLVAALGALAVLEHLGVAPPGDVVVESVTGEETGGLGTLATLLAGWRADAAVVLEPTSLHLCPVGAGSASFRLQVHGRAAHGALRTEGVSAVEKFALIDAALRRFESERHRDWGHPAYRDGTLVAPISVGRVSAGDWPSTVPDLLVAEGRFGVFPGETVATARRAFEEALAAAADADPWLREHPPTVEWFEGQFAPAETPLDHPLVTTVARLHRAVTGGDPVVHGVTYGSDLRLLTAAGIPAVLYGPGDVRLAHTVDEHLDLDELLVAVRVVAELVVGWGGRAKGSAAPARGAVGDPVEGGAELFEGR